jgi:hypothetical protein
MVNQVNRIILCIIDDVRAEHFFEFINKGLLPNLTKLLENGVYSRNCITDFPAITYPTQASILTGTYTGDYRKEKCHGIPLLNWMGRDYSRPILRSYGGRNLQIYKINDDLGDNCRTILEMVGNGNKTSIAQFISRGASYYFPENKRKLIFFYLMMNHWKNIERMLTYANSIVVNKLIDNFKKPKKHFGNNNPPVASLLWVMSSDILMHSFGYDSYIYKLNLLHIDRILGKLIGELKKLGYLSETAIAITSDHGNYKARRVGDLTPIFQALDLKHYHPRKNKKGNVNVAEYGGIGFFNFKGLNNGRFKTRWTHPTLKELKSYGKNKENLLNQLFKIEGSKLMFYRNDENTHNKGIVNLKKIDRKSGKIVSCSIEYIGTGKDQKTKYIPNNENEDVFGYINDETASKLMDNKFHTINEWMNATSHVNYPMFVDLIPRHFKNPRSSDIIVSNDGSVVYNIHHGKRKNKNLYAHDLGTKNNAIVPLIIAGSDEIPQKEIAQCKITDIVPSLLKMIGLVCYELTFLSSSVNISSAIFFMLYIR